MGLSERSLSVTFLGTCGDLPEAGGDAPCFLVNRRLLVDTGWYAVDRLLAYGMDPLDVGAVAITHSHADHYLALPQLLLYWACGKHRRKESEPLRVLGPAQDVEAIVEEARRFIRLSRDPALELPLDVVPLSPGQTLDLGDIRLSTCRARHNVPALAYRLDHRRGASVTFSGDTGPHADIAQLAKGADLLVHDAVHGPNPVPDPAAARHSSAMDAAQIARRAGVAQLALVHMSRCDAERALAAAKKAFPATILPREGDTLEIPFC